MIKEEYTPKITIEKFKSQFILPPPPMKLSPTTEVLVSAIGYNSFLLALIFIGFSFVLVLSSYSARPPV